MDINDKVHVLKHNLLAKFHKLYYNLPKLFYKIILCFWTNFLMKQ